MKQDEAKEMLDRAVAELFQALGEGRSERLERYLEVMSRFHRYSFGNVLMILAQIPNASRVAGYRCWQALGRQVKQGERGIAIFAPLIRRRKKDDENDQHFLFGFRVVHVFDVSQTDGKPLAEFANVVGHPEQNLERIETLIRGEGIELEYTPLPPGTLGCSSGGRITIRPDLPPADRFSVVVHELIHEKIHHTQRKHDASTTVLETEAEACAFVVCRAIGLDSMAKSADYIQLYRGGPETLAESLDAIQKTAAWVIDAISSTEGLDNKAHVPRSIGACSSSKDVGHTPNPMSS